MKVLVQDTATKYYLAADGRWLQNPAQGRSFGDISFALCFCRSRGIFSANVILAFNDADLNVSLTGPRRIVLG